MRSSDLSSDVCSSDLDAQHLVAETPETGDAGAHLIELFPRRDQGEAGAGQRQAGLAQAGSQQGGAPAGGAGLEQAGMVDGEDADIDACAAQPVPLVLSWMAERAGKSGVGKVGCGTVGVGGGR